MSPGYLRDKSKSPAGPLSCSKTSGVWLFTTCIEVVSAHVFSGNYPLPPPIYQSLYITRILQYVNKGKYREKYSYKRSRHGGHSEVKFFVLASSHHKRDTKFKHEFPYR